MASIKELAAAYRAARRNHDNAKALEALKKTELEAAESAMIAAMVEEGLTNTCVDGVTFTPKRSTEYSCLAVNRDRLLNMLEADGYRNMFTVNPKALNALMKEIAGNTETGTLPEQYAEIMNTHNRTTLSVRGLKGE